MSHPERPMRPPRKIYPWSMSATASMGLGFDEHQLLMLQAFDLDHVAEELDERPYGIMPAVLEIFGHGNDRRAVELARRVVALNPAHMNRFREFMDEAALHAWFEKPLDEFPSQPSEIKGLIEYVQ